MKPTPYSDAKVFALPERRHINSKVEAFFCVNENEI